ncbi:helix-loop-helix DNA-binding domain-containing protein [Ditylenchus destructor]|uniref:Helix-loop-helix DNA-binding domain-containing protein n=1 Tax=Ditylenchus destructor TaxID=166010 RepID=A0AAD4MFT9_9BILA|nr:helix-loop-helix DNA-binding domain-containing protein [Ditylenchus destructor]
MAYRSFIDYFPQSINDTEDDSEESSESESDCQDQPRERDQLIWSTTNNGNKRPFYQLYPFHLDYSKSGKNYWKCDKCKDGCKARLHTISETNELLRFIGHSLHQAHNHSVDPIALPLAQVKSTLNEMTRERAKNVSNLSTCNQHMNSCGLSPQSNCLGFKRPLKEKRRREKVNSCLEELKELLLQCNLGNSAKLDKTDILQMTVIRMTELQQENRRLLQQVQQLCQSNNEQAYLDAVQEGLSVFTTATSDALLRMPMPAPLNTLGYRQMLHDEVIGRLNAHISGQSKMTQNPSIDDSRSLPSGLGSIPGSQQSSPVSFSIHTPPDSFHSTPEPAIPQLPFHVSSDPQYDHLAHMNLVSQAQPITVFQSVSPPFSIYGQVPYHQTSPGFHFSGCSADSLLPSPVIVPSSRANIATSNDYLLHSRQNNYPQAMFPNIPESSDASNMATSNDYSWISRQVLKRKAVELSRQILWRRILTTPDTNERDKQVRLAGKEKKKMRMHTVNSLPTWLDFSRQRSPMILGYTNC